MFCPQCGNQLPDSASFCGKCGTRIEQQPVNAKPVLPAVNAQASDGAAIAAKPRNSKVAILAVAIVAIAAVVLIRMFACSGTTSQSGSSGIPGLPGVSSSQVDFKGVSIDFNKVAKADTATAGELLSKAVTDQEAESSVGCALFANDENTFQTVVNAVKGGKSIETTKVRIPEGGWYCYVNSTLSPMDSWGIEHRGIEYVTVDFNIAKEDVSAEELVKTADKLVQSEKAIVWRDQEGIYLGRSEGDGCVTKISARKVTDSSQEAYWFVRIDVFPDDSHIGQQEAKSFKSDYSDDQSKKKDWYKK